jgi:hypothetical protein
MTGTSRHRIRSRHNRNRIRHGNRIRGICHRICHRIRGIRRSARIRTE